MRFPGLLIIGIFFIKSVSAQGLQPIGQWREHLPWGEAIQVKTLNKDIICATPYAVFTYDIENKEILRKSKVNGLSAIGIVSMAVDDLSGSIVIAYKDKMIDILRKDVIIPVPDLKITKVEGDFTINSIVVDQGIAYISTNAGILLLNIEKHEIKERWLPGYTEEQKAALSICKVADYWYASTKYGLRKIRSSNDGSDPDNWEIVSATPWVSSSFIKKIISIDQSVVVWVDNDIFKSKDDFFQKIYSSDLPISGMDITDNGILISTVGDSARITYLSLEGIVSKVFHSDYLKQPQNALIFNQECWVADLKNGLLRIGDNSSESITPQGPAGFAKGDIKYFDGSMWFASSSVKELWQPTTNKLGIFKFSDEWQKYNQDNFQEMDTIPDIISIAFQPVTGKLFAASFGGGLLEINNRNVLKLYKYNSGLQQYPDGSGQFNVSGLAVDQFSNLWISNFGSDRQFHLLKPDGQWSSFTIPFAISYNAVAGITIDDEDQKWVVLPKGNGLLVWNTGKIPEDPLDDQWKLLTKGTGAGNLPSNNVSCVVKDRNGLIWVGTDKGIGIFNCRNNTFSNTCDAILPVVSNTDQSGYLFQDQKINAIAIDGANRKWIGTTNGLWLLSDDGEKVIFQFNTENSRLLSNEILSMALHPLTGELFVATSNGICSFMSTATENLEEKHSVLVFPNPVPAHYSGVIAIRGLPENSWVKITELSGRLVFQGKSLGGQMIWNGKEGTGRDVTSGVYLVLSANETGEYKLVTKIFLTR